MKFWKNWPYWVKGGVIVSGIVLISCLILIFAGDKGNNILDYIYFPALIIEVVAIIPLGIIAIGLLGLKEEIFLKITGEFGTGVPTITGLLLLIIIWFIIGAILGWLYGKIKNRQLNINNNSLS